MGLRQYKPLKRQSTAARLHGAISHKALILVNICLNLF
jgi:hypothetical protein